MAKGDVHPGEATSFSDERTGAPVRQITTADCLHHHPFYYIPAYDDDMHWLFFVSHRTGAPQIFAEERSTGKLVQITDRRDLNEWSIHPGPDGRYVYFTAGTAAWRVSLNGWKEESLASFGDVPMIPKGMVGDAMGTTTLSTDGRWWAVPVKVGTRARLNIIDTATGHHNVILERDSIGHPQFHPDDSNLIRYAGRYHERMWVLNRDGSENRLVYRRDVAKKEWIVHETWMPGRRELVTTNWPYGMFGIDIDTGAIRPVCRFNSWHPMVSRDGTLMVADTNFPDWGLQLFDPRDGKGEPRLLCHSKSSNRGAHWNTDHCPYDDGPIDVYAPQHTHPHPNFSPDRSRVVFTSDRTGQAQLYEVLLPPS